MFSGNGKFLYFILFFFSFWVLLSFSIISRETNGLLGKFASSNGFTGISDIWVCGCTHIVEFLVQLILELNNVVC